MFYSYTSIQNYETLTHSSDKRNNSCKYCACRINDLYNFRPLIMIARTVPPKLFILLLIAAIQIVTSAILMRPIG